MWEMKILSGSPSLKHNSDLVLTATGRWSIPTNISTNKGSQVFLESSHNYYHVCLYSPILRFPVFATYPSCKPGVTSLQTKMFGFLKVEMIMLRQKTGRSLPEILWYKTANTNFWGYHINIPEKGLSNIIPPHPPFALSVSLGLWCLEFPTKKSEPRWTLGTRNDSMPWVVGNCNWMMKCGRC